MPEVSVDTVYRYSLSIVRNLTAIVGVVSNNLQISVGRNYENLYYYDINLNLTLNLIKD